MKINKSQIARELEVDRRTVDKYINGFTGVYCNFCHYLRKYSEFDSYFRKSKPSNTDKVTIRYETPMGKQAQLDLIESIPFILSSGETIDVNIFFYCFRIPDLEFIELISAIR